MKNLIDKILADPCFPMDRAWKRCRYKAGEKIIEKDSIGKSLFLIEDGSVRVQGGVEVESNVRINPGLCDLEAGALFGDNCLFGDHRRTASVVALTDTCMLEIRSDMLRSYFDDHPVLGYQFLKILFEVMARRLELANERIENLLVWGIKVHDINKYL